MGWMRCMGGNKGEKGSFMFRKSALTMAMLSALTTSNVVALGLGEIQLRSALNQPLDAEVELLSATPEELQELKVEVASPQAFASAGIERTLFLNKLQFDVKTNADGKAVVQITSRDVVREPFLDFLLELSWSKGRLLREYTVLVDPPVTMPAAAPAPRVPSARSVTARAPLAPAGRVTHTAQLPPLSRAPGEYQTQRNDTLWKVARQVRPDASVSMEQTMLGLLRANPEAFHNNNINNLKAGYILRVPDREEMMAISQTEALRETRRQYAQWREAQNLLAPAEAPVAPQTPVAQVQGGGGAASLQLVAPELSEAGAAGSSAAGSGGLDAVQHDLMIANETLEAQRRQGEEMSSRLAVLEEQIRNMQRLIQLKDDELARLQAQVGQEMPDFATGDADPVEAGMESAAQAASPEAVEGAPGAEAVVVAEAAVSEQSPGLDVTGADPASSVDVSPVGEVAGDGLPATDTVVADDASGAPTMERPLEATADQSAAEPVAVQAPSVAAEPGLPETFTPPGFVDKLLTNPLWLGAGAVLLAVVGFLGLRRKRGSDSEFQESILQAAREKSSAGSETEIIRSKPESVHSTTTASSLLSEFAVSDMGSMKHDGEADPLAEADVYLAYGRFQQAEELIKDALQSKPEQEDLHLKLLEVYLAARNPTAFDEHAQEVLGRLENSDHPVWQKIAEMGRELSPENPLYEPGAGASPHLRGGEDQADSFATAMDAPEGYGNQAKEFTEEFTEQVSELGEGLDFAGGLSFDSGEVEDELKPDSAEFTPPEPVAKEPESAEADSAQMDSIEPDTIDVGQDNTLEFDLEDLDLGGDEEMDLPGDGELADLDEVSTKLDLARAYLDMGDPDGARSILGEVIEEGSDDQKSEAQQILEKIA